MLQLHGCHGNRWKQPHLNTHVSVTLGQGQEELEHRSADPSRRARHVHCLAFLCGLQTLPPSGRKTNDLFRPANVLTKEWEELVMQPLPQESAGEEGIKQKVIGEPVRVQGHLEFSCLVMVYFSFSVMKGELGWFLEPTDSPGVFLICFLSSPAYCCCRCSQKASPR